MNRRHFLTGATATAATATLGGCLGGILSFGQSSVFNSITTQGTKLLVSFHDGTDIQKVNLIRRGKVFNSTQLQAGESRAAIGLLALNPSKLSADYYYEPGVYGVTAVGSDGTEHTREVTIRPRPTVTNLDFLHDRQTDTYGLHTRNAAPVITIKNTSPTKENESKDKTVLAGPDIISDSGVTGPDVPLPHPQSAAEGADVSNLGKTTGELSAHDLIAIGANTTTRLITDYIPFGFLRDEASPSSPVSTYLSANAVQQQWGGKTIKATLVLTTFTGTTVDFTVTFDGTVQKLVQIGMRPAYSFNGATIQLLEQSGTTTTPDPVAH
jgi:hypothetical protein